MAESGGRSRRPPRAQPHRENPQLPDPGPAKLLELAGTRERERLGVRESRAQSRYFRVELQDQRVPFRQELLGSGEPGAQVGDQRLALLGVPLGIGEPRLEQRPLVDALGQQLPQLFRPDAARASSTATRNGPAGSRVRNVRTWRT